MSESEVTRDGQRGVHPSGEATTGVNVPPGGGGARRKRRRSEPEFRSYYELPILNKPQWETPDVAGYLFLGGLAGASGVIAAAARLTDRPALARVSSLGAAAAGQTGLGLLIHDLGRPARFLNMLRMVKVTSPMSIGSWLLAGFLPLTDLAAAGTLTGKMPRRATAASIGAGLLGAPVATYTAALIGDTAVPAWHDGHRYMPFVFASSALAAAAGLGLAAAPLHETAPLIPLAAGAGLAEAALTSAMHHRMGVVAETYETGTAHRYLRTAEILTVAGALLTAAGRRSRLRAALGGSALLAGSALTRFGIFHAGIASTEDPKYVVVPQRERADAAQTTHKGATIETPAS
jgi:formate-dependent nitrite reductase membrane component NrfD